jgi:hypothetical protein
MNKNHFLGTISRPSGQLGNHLFQKYFLERLSILLGVQPFHRSYDGRDYITKLACQGFNLRTLSRSWRNVSRKDLSVMDLNSLSDFILTNIADKVNSIFPSGVLDPYFFDLPMIDPNSIFKIIKNSPSDSRWSANFDESRRVALHFRGGDFEEWDKQAVLPASYYLDSLDALGADHSFDLNLFTDDIGHPTVRKLRSQIPNLKIQSNSPRQDLISMSESRFIISSPSSFCFWATVLNTPKVIVNSKSWLDYKCSSNDNFWIGLREGNFPFYMIDFEI